MDEFQGTLKHNKLIHLKLQTRILKHHKLHTFLVQLINLTIQRQNFK